MGSLFCRPFPTPVVTYRFNYLISSLAIIYNLDSLENWGIFSFLIEIWSSVILNKVKNLILGKFLSKNPISHYLLFFHLITLEWVQIKTTFRTRYFQTRAVTVWCWSIPMLNFISLHYELLFAILPKKSFETIRYFGVYSNNIRGLRAKAEILHGEIPTEELTDEVEVIDVSRYQPKNVPSHTWRDVHACWSTLKDMENGSVDWYRMFSRNENHLVDNRDVSNQKDPEISRFAGAGL